MVRERAAHSLGNIGDMARDVAAPSLRGLLRDHDEAVRRRAAWALGLMHDSCEDSVQSLAGVIASGTLGDAAAGLHALGNIGKSVGPGFLAPYREQILAAFDSPDKDVRRWALYAAEAVGLDIEAWAALLVKVARRDDSSENRCAALMALEDIAPSVDLTSAVPALTARLAEPTREASLTFDVLGAMRPRPTQAIPFLHKALERDELVLPAGSALWRIEGRAEPIVAALRRIFVDYAEEACDLVCQLGPEAAPLVPDILDALAEENWDLQWAAADALQAIASSDHVVLPPLLDALGHPSPIVRSASARALAAAGAVAVTPLQALLIDTSEPRAAWAAFALGEMGPVAAESLSVLHAGMRSGAQPLASCCAIAVARIAADADAVPHLLTTLRSEDRFAPRQAAAMALAELGPAASDAVTALEGLVDDEDPHVADAAMQALLAIRGMTH